MNPLVKKLILVVILVFIGAVALGTWWFLPGRLAEVHLSPVSEEAVPYSALPSEPIYLQTDSRWAEEKIGGSGESLRSVGCTICCLSMALAHHGVMENPMELNRKLKEGDGYTYRGWVKWDVIKRVTSGLVCVVPLKNPSHRDINEALAEGNPVLVKIILPSGFQHWVLVVGRDQKEYLMKDPLGDGKSLQPLSSLGSDIFAVRIVKRL